MGSLKLIKEGSFFRIKGTYTYYKQEIKKLFDENGEVHYVPMGYKELETSFDEQFKKNGFSLCSYKFDPLKGLGSIIGFKYHRSFGQSFRDTMDIYRNEFYYGTVSTNDDSLLIQCLFSEGLLDRRITNVYSEKTGGSSLTDHIIEISKSNLSQSISKEIIEYARKNGVFCFQLFRYGYNNQIVYEIEAKDVFLNPEKYNLKAFRGLFDNLKIDLSTEKGQIGAVEKMMLEIKPRSRELIYVYK